MTHVQHQAWACDLFDCKRCASERSAARAEAFSREMAVIFAEEARARRNARRRELYALKKRRQL